MAPDAAEATGVLYESDAVTADLGLAHAPVHKADPIQWTYRWNYIFAVGFLHIAAPFGLYMFLFSAKWQTDIFAAFVYMMGMVGITAGVHRLWSHKAYKAKWPLRFLLVCMSTPANQYSVIEWVQLHRTHHRYSDTDADPYNASRGFFFSHLGWLFVEKHPEYVRRSNQVDMSDLYSDPVLRFQHKYYWELVGIFSFFVPTLIPVYLWNETWTNAFFVAVAFRACFSMHAVATINSVAHIWGYKPYDGTIKPTETLFGRVITFGEGAHNFHHTFPWDYKTSEFNLLCDWATYFIDFFAKIGWAYDLKSVSQDMILKRTRRTGDGSHPSVAADEDSKSRLKMGST